MSKKYKSNKWLILFNVALGTFMATLDGSIVNVALPSIAAGLSIDITTVQWVITSYLITVSALLLSFGRLSDIYGRKFLYFLGFIIFTIGSLFCGLASTINMLVAARIVKAVGASILMSTNQAIITDAFPAGERGKALGISGTVVALGSLTGPSLGGMLTGLFGWASIFLINIPIGIFGAILSLLVLSDNKKTADERFDYAGGTVLAAAVILFFSGLLKLSEHSRADTFSIISVISAGCALCLFFYIELKAAFPIVDMGLFKIRLFSLGLGTAFLSFVSMNAVTIMMPFYLQGIRFMTPAKTGLVMMAYPSAMALFAPVSGWLSDKIGYKFLTAAGLTIATLTYLGLANLNIHTEVYKIIILLIMLGVGVGIFQSPNNSSIMSAVPNRRLGVAASINALVRNIGMVTGITISMTIYSYMMNLQGFSDSLDTIESAKAFIISMRAVYSSAAIIAASGVILTFARIRTLKKMKDQQA